MRPDFPNHRSLAQRLPFLLLACCMAMPLSCSKQEAAEPTKSSGEVSNSGNAGAGGSSASANSKLSDADLPAWKREILDLAWMAASKIPNRPHIKTRAKLQQQVCGANIEFEQLHSVAALIDQIPNYRKGVALADYAYHCLKKDASAPVAASLAKAQEVADGLKNNQNEQVWRRDRIRTHMARAYLALGATEKANALTKGVGDAEVGEFVVAKAERLTREQFETNFEAIQVALKGQSFEQKKGAVGASIRLHDMFFGDEKVRELIESELVSNTKKMPLTLQTDLRVRLAENHVAHDQHTAALKLIDEAQKMMAGSALIARDRIPHMARLCGARAAAGDVTGARTLHSEALALYEESRENTVDIYRAGLMRPLAEAAVKMKDHAQARGLYLRAVNEGTVNPNAVPCTEDLVATCLSMLRHDVSPDPALMARLQSIGKGLSQPW